jgi:membrane protease YdiL (CAAX protease family)
MQEGRASHRWIAIAEVTAAFAVVHVTYRAVKHFTAIGRLDDERGLNFTPGVVMILFAVGILLVCRRSFTAYGLSLGGWRESLKAGLFCGLLVVGGAGLLYLCGIQHRAGSSPPGLWEGCGYALACLAGVFLLVRLSGPMRGLAARMPAGIGLALLAVVLSVPMMITVWQGRPVLPVALTTMWLVVGAGIGEEVFFRGYIQSRVNEAFGRPLRLRKIQLGLGVVVSSLLFGFTHALNTVDYFQGRFSFAWGFGIATFGAGLLFGVLRESTGNIWAGAVAHAILDVAARIPTLLG